MYILCCIVYDRICCLFDTLRARNLPCNGISCQIFFCTLLIFCHSHIVIKILLIQLKVYWLIFNLSV